MAKNNNKQNNGATKSNAPAAKAEPVVDASKVGAPADELQEELTLEEENNNSGEENLNSGDGSGNAPEQENEELSLEEENNNAPEEKQPEVKQPGFKKEPEAPTVVLQEEGKEATRKIRAVKKIKSNIGGIEYNIAEGEVTRIPASAAIILANAQKVIIL